MADEQVIDAEYTEQDQPTTAVATRPDAGGMQIIEGHNPVEALQTAQKLVGYMQQQCTGPAYISNIQGRQYPKVEWWTTAGASLQLFPVEESCRRIDRRDGSYGYEAKIGVYRSGQLVTRGSAICMNSENNWGNRDEYAVRSMAITRATAKAYRIGLSFLAVLAGLEPTPSEEVPPQGFNKPATQTPTHGSQQQTPPRQQQQAPQQQNQQSGEIDNPYQTIIKEAKVAKTGTGAKGPWTLYAIIDVMGVEFRTFDATNYETAQHIIDSCEGQALIGWSSGKYGKNLDSIESYTDQPQGTDAPPAPQQQQPKDKDPWDNVHLIPPKEGDQEEDTVLIESVDSRTVQGKDGPKTVWGLNTNKGRVGTMTQVVAEIAESVAGTGELMTITYIYDRRGPLATLIKGAAEDAPW